KTTVGATTLIPLILMGMAVAMASNYAADIFETNLSIFGLQNTAGSVESSAMTPFEIILNIISVAIVPAFAEEFAYRGLVMGSLKKYGRAFAVVASAILFSAMHSNTTQIVFTLPVGLIFGYIDIITDSILPSILLHFMNNFYAILFTILYTNSNLDERELTIVQLIIVLLFLVSGVLSFIYLARSKKVSFSLSDKEKPIEKGAELLTLKNKMSAFLVNPGVMISMSVFLTFTILCLTPLNQ
ncbi:MAG: CPBP family intramembrane metalloprotease, partial [Ruminococcus sp.]|nr:CPBP family intramembrane metalloprotease [Ruminococcus sp.]